MLRYSTTTMIPASIQLFRWSLKRIRPVMCTIALGLVAPSCFFSTCKTLLLVKTAIFCEFNQQLPTNPFISGDISLNPGPLTQSQSVKSKDILDRLYPTLYGELSSSKGLEIGHLNVNGCFAPQFWVLLRLKTHQENNVNGI